MKRTFLKTSIIKAFVLGMCLTSVISTAALAGTISKDVYTIQIESVDNGNQLFEKQKEIDEYVFQKHVKEIEEKGFTVTHTAPLENYVEIGITPYSKDNAEYLYGVFGSDSVKVVEGQQAVLLNEGSADGTAYENQVKTEQTKANFLTHVLEGAASFTKFLKSLL
ncbi:hypothetical protein GOM49_13325 [Clostridium bovifaecis]|uniref:DUF1002 domain-containing protein n=1 Tax=Clostridium bovifaecis TaxID=2184719 RepID=A0A6I6F0A2_9CLOT|nr:hypothetical protein GOM49_13325 [Clostridium bovifaecis]